MERRRTSDSFLLMLMVFFAVLLTTASSVGVSSARVSASILDHPKIPIDEDSPYVAGYESHHQHNVKTIRKDLEQRPVRNTHVSLEEHDPGDRFLEAPSAEALAPNVTFDIGNYTSNVIVVHNDTWDGTVDNGTLVTPQNPEGNASSTAGTTTNEHLGSFETLIKNTVTRLVLKEIKNISYVYKKYFALLYNVSLADIDENAAHDEPSNIIELVEEALSLNSSQMAPGCKVTPVTVHICTIRVFHVGSLPADVVENYNEDVLQDLICPCPIPVLGFLCPMYAGNLILERYRKRCGSD